MTVSDSSLQQTTDYESFDPDVRLMIEVRDDNAAAFESLVRRYQARLISLMEQLVSRRDQAEDLAQEVFLRVYRARKNYQPGAKFSTWLFTIANNVAKNAIRSLSRRKEVHVNAGSQTESQAIAIDQLAKAASGLMPTRQLDMSEMSEIVQLAMESLSERQRMALVLAKFEGMSYIEIAESMGLTVQATKSLLSRARGNLKSILEPYMQAGRLPGTDGESSPHSR